MGTHAHWEVLGPAMVIGALLLASTWLVVNGQVRVRLFQWSLLGVVVAGIVFGAARIVQLSTSAPAVALAAIRVQFGVGFLMPGIGMASMETLARRPSSRTVRVALMCGGVILAWCVASDDLIGPTPVHLIDGFGHALLGGRPTPTAWIAMTVAGTLGCVGMARRIRALPLPTLHAWFLVGPALFMTAGLHDMLVGTGVLKSVFALEYVYVVFGIVVTHYQLRAAAVERDALLAAVQAQAHDLAQREAALQLARRRLERSNQRYRHLADATREGVILCAGLRVLDMNQAACRILGCAGQPRAAFRQLDLRSLAADAERSVVERALRADLGPLEIGLVHPDGQRVTVSLRSIAAPPGSNGSRVLLMRDVSTERELQRRLATADRLAAVGALAAGTAHEINNPLAFVMANAELLDENLAAHADAAAARELCAEIQHGALRIRDVVRDLMSLARDRGGEPDDVDLHEMLRRCVAMAAPTTRHRAQVAVQLDAGLTVRGNEGRLFQVFLNLIVNAAHAIPDGAVLANVIRVVGRRVGADVVIEVADTGAGMPREVLDRIFEPFFTTKAAGQGTGLGLSISHGIITDLGGRIEVESTVGVGTTFRVVLPAGDAPATSAPVAVAASVGPRLRVLVVDDEQRFAHSLARGLDAHDVDVAYSGRAALARIAAGRYDVALCDVMMPDVTGIQVYQALCAALDPLAERFLFMTGGVTSPEAQAFLTRLGEGRWLPKPIPIPELRRLVVELGTGARR